MPRMARAVIAGCPHHVTQRGNRREDGFFTAADRQRDLELLREYARKHGLAVQAQKPDDQPRAPEDRQGVPR